MYLLLEKQAVGRSNCLLFPMHNISLSVQLPTWNIVESGHFTLTLILQLKVNFTLNSQSGFSLSAVNLRLSTLDQWGRVGCGEAGGGGTSWIAMAVFYHSCFIYSTIKYMLTLPPYNLENVKNEFEQNFPLYPT